MKNRGALPYPASGEKEKGEKVKRINKKWDVRSDEHFDILKNFLLRTIVFNCFRSLVPKVLGYLY